MSITVSSGGPPACGAVVGGTFMLYLHLPHPSCAHELGFFPLLLWALLGWGCHLLALNLGVITVWYENRRGLEGKF